MLSKLDRLLRALHNNTVDVADMAGEKLTVEDTKKLAAALQHNTSLTVLVMGGIVVGCALGDAGVEHLAGALIENTTLEKLDLRANQLTNTSAAILAAALVDNHTLTELDLRCNAFDENAGNIFKTYLAGRQKNCTILFDDYILVCNGSDNQHEMSL